MDRRILSYIQAKRCIKKGNQSVLLFIQKEDEEEAEGYKQDPAVTAEHLAELEKLKSQYSHIFGDILHQEAEPRPDMPAQSSFLLC